MSAQDAESVAHDWKAECSGLAYMITEIADQYRLAKAHYGGDSEFLANRILEADRYVNGPLLEIWNRSAQ